MHFKHLLHLRHFSPFTWASGSFWFVSAPAQWRDQLMESLDPTAFPLTCIAKIFKLEKFIIMYSQFICDLDLHIQKPLMLFDQYSPMLNQKDSCNSGTATCFSHIISYLGFNCLGFCCLIGSFMYNQTDGEGWCFTAYCNLSCNVEKHARPCHQTTTPTRSTAYTPTPTPTVTSCSYLQPPREVFGFSKTRNKSS